MNQSKRSTFYTRKIVAPKVARVISRRIKNDKLEYLVEWQPTWENYTRVDPKARQEYDNAIRTLRVQEAWAREVTFMGGFIPEKVQSDNDQEGVNIDVNNNPKLGCKSSSSGECSKMKQEHIFHEITEKDANGNSVPYQFIWMEKDTAKDGVTSDPEGQR